MTGIQFPSVTIGFFLFANMSRLALRPTQWVLGLFPGGLGAQGMKMTTHIPSAEVKYIWSYTSTPPYLHGVVLN